MTKLSKIRNVLGITKADDPVNAVATIQSDYQEIAAENQRMADTVADFAADVASLTEREAALQAKLDFLQAQVKVGDRRITPNLGTTVTVVAIDGDSAAVRFDGANDPRRPNRWYSLRRVATWELLGPVASYEVKRISVEVFDDADDEFDYDEPTSGRYDAPTATF